jgi:hypothetical protein
MKIQTLTTITMLVCVLAACSSTKKSTSVSAPTKNTVSKNGIFEPGNDELVALQAKYSDLNMQTLKEGYAIYKGECTSCHEAKSIYSRAEAQWKGIIDDMAYKAKLNATQKDAVYKYVLAIKATQPTK